MSYCKIHGGIILSTYTKMSRGGEGGCPGGIMSVSHPKHMLKLMGKKTLQFYAENFCLSKPVWLLQKSELSKNTSKLNPSLIAIVSRIFDETVLDNM